MLDSFRFRLRNKIVNFLFDVFANIYSSLRTHPQHPRLVIESLVKTKRVVIKTKDPSTIDQISFGPASINLRLRTGSTLTDENHIAGLLVNADCTKHSRDYSDSSGIPASERPADYHQPNFTDKPREISLYMYRNVDRVLAELGKTKPIPELTIQGAYSFINKNAGKIFFTDLELNCFMNSIFLDQLKPDGCFSNNQTVCFLTTADMLRVREAYASHRQDIQLKLAGQHPEQLADTDERFKKNVFPLVNVVVNSFMLSFIRQLMMIILHDARPALRRRGLRDDLVNIGLDVMLQGIMGVPIINILAFSLLIPVLLSVFFCYVFQATENSDAYHMALWSVSMLNLSLHTSQNSKTTIIQTAAEAIRVSAGVVASAAGYMAANRLFAKLNTRRNLGPADLGQAVEIAHIHIHHQ